MFDYWRKRGFLVQALNLFFGELGMLLYRYTDSEIIIILLGCRLRWLCEEESTLFIGFCTTQRINTCCFVLGGNLRLIRTNWSSWCRTHHLWAISIIAWESWNSSLASVLIYLQRTWLQVSLLVAIYDILFRTLVNRLNFIDLFKELLIICFI